MDNNTITPEERNNSQKVTYNFNNDGHEKNVNHRNHQQSYAEYESAEP